MRTVRVKLESCGLSPLQNESRRRTRTAATLLHVVHAPLRLPHTYFLNVRMHTWKHTLVKPEMPRATKAQAFGDAAEKGARGS